MSTKQIPTEEQAARSEQSEATVAARRYTVTVDADGKVTIPDTVPGETVTIAVQRSSAADRSASANQANRPLSPEQQAMLEQTLELGRRVREAASPGWLALDHGELLYDDNGLPK